jgi:hypothetical protein
MMAQERVVTIVLNHVDIEHSVHTTPFNKDCVICLDDFQCDIESENTLEKKDVILSCGHMYHDECIRFVIMSQLKTNSSISCPICRYVFIERDDENYVLARQEIGTQSNQLQTVQPYSLCYMCIRMFLPLFVFSSIMICAGLIVYFTVPS